MSKTRSYSDFFPSDFDVDFKKSKSKFDVKSYQLNHAKKNIDREYNKDRDFYLERKKRFCRDPLLNYMDCDCVDKCDV